MTADGSQAPGLSTAMEAGEYPAMYRVEDRLWWYRGLRQVVMHFLATFVPPGGTVLDVGCGTGKNLEVLRASGYRSVGVEYAEDAIRFCQMRGLDRIQRGSASHLPIRDRTFDGVICLDVIGLLGEAGAAQAVAELGRVLRPGGVVVGHFAALEALRSPHDDVCHLVHRYTVAELRRLFGPPLWEIQRCTYRVFFLLPPVGLVKVGKRLLRRSGEAAQGDLFLPPAPLNTVLSAIQWAENVVLWDRDLPVGSSALIVARRI